jgi:hypothetical protein
MVLPAKGKLSTTSCLITHIACEPISKQNAPSASQQGDVPEMAADQILTPRAGFLMFDVNV